MTRESHRTDSGAGEPAGATGSRVAVGHHVVTRSALDAARRLVESGAQGRRRNGEVRSYSSHTDHAAAAPAATMSATTPATFRFVRVLSVCASGFSMRSMISAGRPKVAMQMAHNHCESQAVNVCALQEAKERDHCRPAAGDDEALRSAVDGRVAENEQERHERCDAQG